MSYLQKFYSAPGSINWTEEQVQKHIKAYGVHAPNGQIYVRKPHGNHRTYSTLPRTSESFVAQFVGANQQVMVTLAKARDTAPAHATRAWKDSEVDGLGRCSDDDEDGEDSSGSSGIVCGSARVISAQGGFETPSALEGRLPPPTHVSAPAKRSQLSIKSIGAAVEKTEEVQKREGAEL